MTINFKQLASKLDSLEKHESHSIVTIGSAKNLQNIQTDGRYIVFESNGIVGDSLVKRLESYRQELQLSDDDPINSSSGLASKKTIIMLTVEKADLELLKHLLDHGADPTILDSKGNNAFTIAAKKGHLTILQELLTLIKDSQPSQTATLTSRQTEPTKIENPTIEKEKIIETETDKSEVDKSIQKQGVKAADLRLNVPSSILDVRNTDNETVQSILQHNFSIPHTKVNKDSTIEVIHQLIEQSNGSHKTKPPQQKEIREEDDGFKQAWERYQKARVSYKIFCNKINDEKILLNKVTPEIPVEHATFAERRCHNLDKINVYKAIRLLEDYINPPLFSFHVGRRYKKEATTLINPYLGKCFHQAIASNHDILKFNEKISIEIQKIKNLKHQKWGIDTSTYNNEFNSSYLRRLVYIRDQLLSKTPAIEDSLEIGAFRI